MAVPVDILQFCYWLRPLCKTFFEFGLYADENQKITAFLAQTKLYKILHIELLCVCAYEYKVVERFWNMVGSDGKNYIDNLPMWSGISEETQKFLKICVRKQFLDVETTRNGVCVVEQLVLPICGILFLQQKTPIMQTAETLFHRRAIVAEKRKMPSMKKNFCSAQIAKFMRTCLELTKYKEYLENLYERHKHYSGDLIFRLINEDDVVQMFKVLAPLTRKKVRDELSSNRKTRISDQICSRIEQFAAFKADRLSAQDEHLLFTNCVAR